MLVGPTMPRCKHTHPFPDGATSITVETKPVPYACTLCELDKVRDVLKRLVYATSSANIDGPNGQHFLDFERTLAEARKLVDSFF